MDIGLRELYEIDFDTKMKWCLRNNIETALKAHKMFLDENEVYFNCPKRSSVIGQLRTFAIEKQLFNGAMTPNALYSASFVEVNNFRYQVLYMKTDSFLINIARTMSSKLLPSASRYRLENAAANDGIDGQLKLPFCQDEKSIGDRKYVLLTYNIDSKNNLKHLDLIIPNSSLNAFYECDNLMELPRFVKPNLAEYEEEKQIVKLKEEIQKQAQYITRSV